MKSKDSSVGGEFESALEKCHVVPEAYTNRMKVTVSTIEKSTDDHNSETLEFLFNMKFVKQCETKMLEFGSEKRIDREEVLINIEDRGGKYGGVFTSRQLGLMINSHTMRRDIKRRKEAIRWIHKLKSASCEEKDAVTSVLSASLFKMLQTGVEGRDLLSICDMEWLYMDVIKAFATRVILPQANCSCGLVVPTGEVVIGRDLCVAEMIRKEVQKHSLVLIPLNASGHYGLIVVNRSENRLFILDSFRRSPQAYLEAWNYAAGEVKKIEELNRLETVLVVMEVGQKDKVSCGVWLLHFMEQFAYGLFDYKNSYIASKLSADELRNKRWQILRSLALGDIMWDNTISV